MAEIKRILIVDDEPTVLKVVEKRLQVSGYDVEVAHNGQEGLEKARSLSPDLIVLDLLLPKLNGYEVCMMLKQDTRYQHIPIILFSARTQDSDKDIRNECGANAYVEKHRVADELLDKVRALLSETSHGDMPTSAEGSDAEIA